MTVDDDDVGPMEADSESCWKDDDREDDAARLCCGAPLFAPFDAGYWLVSVTEDADDEKSGRGGRWCEELTLGLYVSRRLCCWP